MLIVLVPGWIKRKRKMKDWPTRFPGYLPPLEWLQIGSTSSMYCKSSIVRRLPKQKNCGRRKLKGSDWLRRNSGPRLPDSANSLLMRKRLGSLSLGRRQGGRRQGRQGRQGQADSFLERKRGTGRVIS